MFIITDSCGRCSQRVDFRFVSVGGGGEFPLPYEVPILGRGPKGEYLTDPNDPGPEVEGHAMASCPRCKHPTLIDFRTRQKVLESIRDNIAEPQGLAGGADLIQITATYPPKFEPESDPAWPKELAKQFIDCQTMLVLGITPSIIIGTCRTVLDIATKNLDQSLGNKTLAERINRLLQAGIITKPLADWSHAIRLDGNDAVHDGVGSHADADEYISFLKMFLNMTFVLPDRIEKRRAPN